MDKIIHIPYEIIAHALSNNTFKETKSSLFSKLIDFLNKFCGLKTCLNILRPLPR